MLIGKTVSVLSVLQQVLCRPHTDRVSLMPLHKVLCAKMKELNRHTQASTKEIGKSREKEEVAFTVKSHAAAAVYLQTLYAESEECGCPRDFVFIARLE